MGQEGQGKRERLGPRAEGESWISSLTELGVSGIRISKGLVGSSSRLFQLSARAGVY